MEKIQDDIDELEDANNIVDSYWNHNLNKIVKSLMIQVGQNAS